MCTVVPLFDWHEGAYTGGAFQLQTLMTWGTMMTRPAAGQDRLVDPQTWNWDQALRYLPLSTWDEQIGAEIPWMRAWVAHPTYDTYWAKSRIIDKLDRIRAANLTISGWYDLFVAQALQHVAELRREADSDTARRNQFLVVGPWGHGPNALVGDRAYGSSASIEFDEIQRRWFDHWLKDCPSDIDQWPALRIFVMGRNQWRDESYWPLEQTQWTRYFFHSGGRANTLEGDGILNCERPGDEPADRFVYDPDNPVPTHGGALLFGPGGARDQQQIEQRDDVLVYTSSPLTAELEVTGPIRVVLYAASDAPDTDWTAKLADVDPDGRAWHLCDGIIRARYRESTQKPTLLTPGKVYRYEIDLWATSNAFLPGHRMRVEISSSNFPRFDRNPNTGHAFGADAQLRQAQQVVYHNADRPSHILLPIIPTASVPKSR
jgi:putative CocE/NonD family hydrolase